MVIHWNTVRRANRMLSNWVIPSLGPIQWSVHEYRSGHWRTPQGNSDSEESTVWFSERRRRGMEKDRKAMANEQL